MLAASGYVSVATPRRPRPVVLRDERGTLCDVEGFREGFREVSSGLRRPEDLAATQAADAVLDRLVAEVGALGEPLIDAPSEVFLELVVPVSR